MAQGALPVTLFWHDHFLICPTRHLLDPEHRYCGVPEVAECARCLPDNPNCLDAPLRKTDIALWRRHWGQLLNGISVIRVFSASSAKLVERVWPEYADKVRLQPHEVNLQVGSNAESTTRNALACWCNRTNFHPQGGR